MGLSHVKQVQEKQGRAVSRARRRRKCLLGAAKGQPPAFSLGTHGKQMTWRKDRAIEAILAIGG